MSTPLIEQTLTVTDADVRAVSAVMGASRTLRLAATVLVPIGAAVAVFAAWNGDDVIAGVLATLLGVLLFAIVLLTVVARRSARASMPVGRTLSLRADADGITLAGVSGTTTVRHDAIRRVERRRRAIAIVLTNRTVAVLPGRLLDDAQVAELASRVG